MVGLASGRIGFLVWFGGVLAGILLHHGVDTFFPEAGAPAMAHTATPSQADLDASSGGLTTAPQ